MKNSLRFLLPVLVVLAVMASLTQPVLAAGEPPPPGGEPSGKHNSQPDVARPPATSPDQVIKAVEGVYQADAVLKDSRGNPVPLASKLAVGILAAPTATACPPGVMPIWLAGSGHGCHEFLSPTPITDAIASSSTSWTVWVQAPYTYIEAVTVNKSIHVVGENAANTAITGDVTLAAANTTLMQFTINGQVTASGLGGFIHLQDLVVKNPTANPGIQIDNHRGNIVLNNVSANGGPGVVLSNEAGIGSVTVVNSIFNNHSSAGLSITSNGAVKLENVIANGNLGGDGAMISFGKSLDINNGIFNNNTDSAVTGQGNGLAIAHQGTAASSIILWNVAAAGNEEEGLHISTNGSVLVKSSTFQGNTLSGLNIASDKGPVTLNTTSTSGNLSLGALLHINGAGAVTILKSNFSTNTGAGLNIATRGTVTLNNVTASENHGGGEGVIVDNCQETGGKCVSQASVTISSTLGPNNFSANDGSGLLVVSGGNITVTGADLQNNHGDGLQVTAWGIVTLDKVVAQGTLGSWGLEINNSSAASGAPAVIITNSRADNGAGAGGILVTSKGRITLNHTSASGNVSGVSQAGVYLDNCLADPGTGACLGTGSVSISNKLGDNLFNNNQSLNLYIETTGSVTLSGVSANSSLGSGGAFIFNSTSAKISPVTISNSSFNGNLDFGLSVTSQGVISLNSVTANENLGVDGGARLSTSSTSTLKPAISIANGQFSSNAGIGLSAATPGSILLDNITARSNSGQGAVLDTCLVDLLCTGAGTVTITHKLGGSSFDNNGTTGLEVHAAKAITISGISAGGSISSGSGGVILDTSLGLGDITLNSSSMDGNNGDGLAVFSSGAITLNKVSASGSTGGSGAFLYNFSSADPKKVVTITSSLFNGNVGYGLFVKSHNNITLSNVAADSNQGTAGAWLDNCDILGSTCLGSGNVTLLSKLGPNSFSNNSNNGMNISTQGAVNIDKTSFSNNGVGHAGEGLHILKKGTKNDLIACSIFTGNGRYGLSLDSLGGTMTLKGVMISDNVQDAGVYPNWKVTGSTLIWQRTYCGY